MPCICYIKKRFHAKTRKVIQQANEIIAEYAAKGFSLTLRQLYYQLVARDLRPNDNNSYKRLGGIISGARRNGDIDWNAIEDRTRFARAKSHWNHPTDILESAAKSFAIDRWADQDYRPQVWIEKDALIGVIEPVCQELDVTYFSCRGYDSDSAIWQAAQEIRRKSNQGTETQETIIFHLGDHDPSGVDMTRDIAERLELYTGFPVPIKRIALNYDQIEMYDPPPNFAKQTDSRTPAYVKKYGPKSWELDALDPDVLADLIRAEINNLVDRPRWEAIEEREGEYQAQLKQVGDCWDAALEAVQ